MRIIFFNSIFVLLAIYDVIGKQLSIQNVEVHKFGGKIKGSVKLPDSTIKSGIYFVKITYKSETYQAKLIVQ